MEGRIFGFLAAVAAIALAGTALVPTVAASGTWTDTFANPSLIQSSAGVAVANGSVQLRAAALSRQGFSFATATGAGSPSIVLQGSTYYLYYAVGSYGSISIGVATSLDGLNWTDHGTVIAPGFQGTADALDVLYQDVAVVGSTFHMWYSGQDGNTGLYSILHATSADGLSWTGAGTALGTEVVGGNAQSVYGPSVLWNGSAYSMWYTTYDGSHTWIRLATSTDGTSWTRQGVVMAPQAPDDTVGPRFPDVLPTTSGFVMWYTCTGNVQNLCRAKSPDGRAWAREGPVLSPDPNLPGESYVIADPSALETSPHHYRVWYGASGYGGMGGIYSALATDGYASPGYLTSVPIALPTNETWLWLQVDKLEAAGTTIRVSVLDAGSGSPIAGYADVTATNVSLAGIDWRAHRYIELNATLTSSSYDTPRLDAWAVAYGLPPPAPANLLSFFMSPLFLVLLVVVVAGVVGYVLLRRPRRTNPPPRLGPP